MCLEPYDSERRRPKVLACGHTFCLHCLQQEGFGSTCPVDRKVSRLLGRGG